MNEIYQMQTEAQSVTQSVQNSAPKPDFDSLSLEALLAMKADLEQAIVKKQEERLEQIKREVMQLAERSGVSYADLLEQLTARSGKRQKGGAAMVARFPTATATPPIRRRAGLVEGCRRAG